MRLMILNNTDSVLVRLGGSVETEDLLNAYEKLIVLLRLSDKIEVNLSRLVEINTAGIQILLSVFIEAKKAGKSFSITEISQPVEDTIRFLNLTGHIPLPANQKS